MIKNSSFLIFLLTLIIFSVVNPLITWATPIQEISATAYTTPANSLTYAINVPAGLTNSVLLVSYADAGFSGSNASGITYNGTAMTLILEGAPYNPAGWFYLNSPASGNNNIVITIPNGPGTIWSHATVVSGANITASPISNSAMCGTDVCTPTHPISTLIENTLNTVLDELILDTVWGNCVSSPVTVFGTSQTEWGTKPNTCGSNGESRSSEKTATSTGSTMMWETLTASNPWLSIAISIKSAAAGGGAAAVPDNPIIID